MGIRQKALAAHDLIRSVIDRYGADQCYVSLSMGKDSVVVWDLVHTVCPEVISFFYKVDYTDDYYNFGEIEQEYAKRCTLVTRDITDLLADPSVTTHTILDQILPDKPVAFLGLRAEESKSRRQYLRRYGTAHQRKDGKVNVNPIAYWSWQDVEMYIRRRRLPVLNKYEKAGFQARSTIKIPSIMADEELAQLRAIDYDSYRRIKHKVSRTLHVDHEL